MGNFAFNSFFAAFISSPENSNRKGNPYQRWLNGQAVLQAQEPHQP
jgi:hypothetical protein